MDKTLQLQNQIRRNAEEVSSYLGDMRKWEKTIKEKDKKRKEDKGKPSNIRRREVGTVHIKNEDVTPVFTPGVNPLELTPSSMVDLNRDDEKIVVQAISEVPKARGVFKYQDPEAAEREIGNSYFKSGNFPASVKSYTKCLGLKTGNIVAFSNRAMAYLKLKEYNRAVMDCNNALLLDATHVKTLSRRAAALNALGKHRAAVRDLVLANQYEPINKNIRTDLQNARELLRSAVNRAPTIRLSSAWTTTSTITEEEGEGDGEQGVIGDGMLVGLQGPDPSPLRDTPTSPSPPSVVEKLVPPPSIDSIESSKGTKVAIIDDDDDDDEEEEVNVPIKFSSSSSSSSSPSPSSSSSSLSLLGALTEIPPKSVPIPVPVSIPVSTPTTPPTGSSSDSSNTYTPSNSKSSKKEKNKAEGKTTVANPAGAIIVTSCYELERHLISAKGDDKAVAQLLKGLKMSLAKKLLQALMEPTVMYDLLVAIYSHYGERKKLWVKVKDWFELVRSAVRSFTLVCSLLTQVERDAVKGFIIRVKEEVFVTPISAIASVKDKDVAVDVGLLDAMMSDFS